MGGLEVGPEDLVTYRYNKDMDGFRPMIRVGTSSDLPSVEQVAEETGMFLGDELQSFVQELRSHLQATEITDSKSHATLVVVTDGEDPEAPIVGAAYFASEVMAQGVMNLLFIGVLLEARKKGFGHNLLNYFEEAIQNSGARLAIIETASDEMFAPAWALYEKAGYERHARVQDYYDDGLDKLIFWKRP